MVLFTAGKDPSFFSAFNYIDLILNLVVALSYGVTEILFVGNPYRELKKQVEKETKEKKENVPLFQAEEEKEEVKEEKQAKDNKSEMLKMVTTLLDQKKITKEEADKMIERITNDD